MPSLAPGIHRRLLVVVGIVLAATLAGVIALWPPSDPRPEVADTTQPAYDGRIIEVVDSVEEGADPFTGGPGTLRTVTVEVLEGPDSGEVRTLAPVPEDTYPVLRAGDRVDLERVMVALQRGPDAPTVRGGHTHGGRPPASVTTD